MKYTTVFFDLDNTLLDFSAGEACAVAQVLKENGLPHDGDTVKLYSRINKSYWERFESGEISKSEIFESRFKTLLEQLGKDGDCAKISSEYGLNLSLQHQTVVGAKEILVFLRNNGLRVYATTNGIAATQYRRIKESGLEPLFDGVFVSEAAGCQKPEKEYFDFVIANTPEKDRRRILIVGDSQSSDILGGINAGIDTCWYNPHGQVAKYPSKFEIKTLSELKNYI